MVRCESLGAVLCGLLLFGCDKPWKRRRPRRRKSSKAPDSSPGNGAAGAHAGRMPDCASTCSTTTPLGIKVRRRESGAGMAEQREHGHLRPVRLGSSRTPPRRRDPVSHHDQLEPQYQSGDRRAGRPHRRRGRKITPYLHEIWYQRPWLDSKLVMRAGYWISRACLTATPWQTAKTGQFLNTYLDNNPVLPILAAPARR